MSLVCPALPPLSAPILPSLLTLSLWANGVLQGSFCAIWQKVTTHVGFVLFGKISQTHVTFAAIYHNSSNKSLITFVLLRVISTIHVHFSAICTNSSKTLDYLIDFVLFYQIAQTHLELLPFYEVATNCTSVFVLFYETATTHLELLLLFKIA